MRSPQASVEEPLLIMGETRRRALAAHLRACVERWRRAWEPVEGTAAEVEVLEDASRLSELRLHDVLCVQGSARPGQHTLSLLVPMACVPALLGLQGEGIEAAAHHGDEQSLAALLELEALRQLVRELAGSAGESLEVQRHTSPMAAILRECGKSRSVAALIRLDVAKPPLVALLSVPLASAVLPARGLIPNAERIERRRQAIAEQRVAIEALLGHAEVSVCDVARLAVGDVIVLENALGATCRIVVPGGSAIAGAMPGQLDGKRAIQVGGRGNA